MCGAHVTNSLALRHEYAGHGFVGIVMVLGREVMGFDGSVRVVFAVGFACFGCTARAGVLRLGLHQRIERRLPFSESLQGVTSTSNLQRCRPRSKPGGSQLRQPRRQGELLGKLARSNGAFFIWA